LTGHRLLEEVFAHVGDNVNATMTLMRSCDAVITARPNTTSSALVFSINGNVVVVSGKLLVVGIDWVVATASTTMRGSNVATSARISYLVANQLPVWEYPAADAMAYSWDRTIALSAYAPEPITYRLSPGEVINNDQKIAVLAEALVVTLPDGPRSIHVDAVVDEGTIRGTIVRAHAFDKIETRTLVEIASKSEADLAAQCTSRTTHATAYPESGPVYSSGVHIMYALDVSDSSVALTCNGAEVIRHAIRTDGSAGMAVLLGGSTAPALWTVDTVRAVAVVTIYPDGATRVRVGPVDITGRTPSATFTDWTSANVRFVLSGTATVGSVYAVPSFDPSPIVAASYALTSPHFVPVAPPSYVYMGEPFEVDPLTQPPDRSLSFSIVNVHGINVASVDPVIAKVKGTLPTDGAASVTVRASRANGTWLNGTIPIEGLTIVWPALLHLGEATVGTSKRFSLSDIFAHGRVQHTGHFCTQPRLRDVRSG
jgi:hypothetical protein